MSGKNKTDIIRIFISAVFAMSVVLLMWFYKQPRFENIPVFIILAAFFSLIAETAVLVALKGNNKLKRAIKILLLLVVNVSVFTSAVIYSFAPAVILQPHSDEASYEKLQNEAFVQEITFEGAEGKINGWFYNREGNNAPTVLYFYGNYETASGRLAKLCESFDDCAFTGCNFAVFDYPAYGNSEGKCTDETILTFATEVYDELIKINENIVVVGYSVGTGPACYLAAERNVSALILWAPYSDGAALYNNVIDIFYGPLEKLVSFDIDNKEYAKRITAPTLILASEADELISCASSMELADKFSGSCTFVKTPDITHNQFLSSGFVKEKTAEFIRKVTQK